MYVNNKIKSYRELSWFESTAIRAGIYVLKGTVSRYGFGFWWCVGLVLGLHRELGYLFKFFMLCSWPGVVLYGPSVYADESVAAGCVDAHSHQQHGPVRAHWHRVPHWPPVLRDQLELNRVKISKLLSMVQIEWIHWFKGTVAPD
jgi:hypothetical protein